MSSERLWAPWRMEYIGKADDVPEGECVLCTKPAAGDDAANLIVHRGSHCYVMLNLYPYASGHLMVSPFAHIAELTALPDEAAAELMTLVQRSMAAIESVYRPHGFNVGMNQGRAAGAGVAHHIHMHVVPRWSGDNNFMPVLADTRVMPQSLEEAQKLISKEFSR